MWQPSKQRHNVNLHRAARQRTGTSAANRCVGVVCR
jgi:hypothetical protein